MRKGFLYNKDTSTPLAHNYTPPHVAQGLILLDTMLTHPRYRVAFTLRLFTVQQQHPALLAYTNIKKFRRLHLQSLSQELVELSHLGGDRKVDGAVTNLDNETTEDILVNLDRAGDMSARRRLYNCVHERTLLETLSFLPSPMYLDLEMADSRRLRVFWSRG